MNINRGLRWLASNLPAPLVRFLRYRNESLYVRGLRRGPGEQHSVVFFTVRKCASTMMRHLLADVARRQLGLTPLNLAAYYWDATPQGDIYGYLDARVDTLIRPRGYLYAPIRRWIDVRRVSGLRTLAMLRDPRDVVVSSYYSALHSHRPPANRQRQAAFARRREAMQQVPFADWIMAEAVRTQQTYEGFRRHLDRDRVLTYEDMWSDFDAWLDQLGRLLELRWSSRDRDRYRRLADVGAAQPEDQRSHRRKGSPGDFRTKLDPALRQQLTQLFEADLLWLYGRAEP